MQTTATSPLTRRKLLIPVLLLVLLGVLFYPTKKDTPAGNPPELTTTATRAVRAATQLATTKIDADPQGNLAHPRLTLQDALAINPFEPAEKKIDPPANVSAPGIPLTPTSGDVLDVEVIAQTPPPALKLEAIFFDQHGAAAIIEDRIWRMGDRLPDGRTIRHITNQGVELTP